MCLQCFYWMWNIYNYNIRSSYPTFKVYNKLKTNKTKPNSLRFRDPPGIIDRVNKQQWKSERGAMTNQLIIGSVNQQSSDPTVVSCSIDWLTLSSHFTVHWLCLVREDHNLTMYKGPSCEPGWSNWIDKNAFNNII